MASSAMHSMTLESVQLGSVLPAQPAEEIIVDTFPKADAEALHQITVKLETTIFKLLMSASTVQELYSLRGEELFEKYVKLSLAYSNFVSVMIPAHGDFYELVQGTFRVMARSLEETDLLDEGMRSEALFCLATFHRGFALLPSVAHSLRDDAPKDRDQELAGIFVGAMFWSQMHLNCLSFAVRENLAPAPDVLREVLKELRASIAMYAAIREAIDLRTTGEDELSWPNGTLWDAEDEALALESTDERESFIQ